MEPTLPMENKENVNLFDLPVLKEKASKNQQIIAFERRMEIMENYVRKYGLTLAKKFTKKLAQDYNVGERRIYQDWDWIKGNFKPEDLRQSIIDLKVLRGKALTEAMEYLTTAQGAEKPIAIRTAIEVSRSFREELEAWGEKPKVADRNEISVHQEPVIFNLIEKSMEEIKNARSGNKPQTNRDT
jgi:hypothetical protein